MNMRSFAVVLGTLTAAGLVASAFSACVVTQCTGNNCGIGGGGGGTSVSTSTSVSSSSSSSASTSTSTSTSSSTSSSSGGACDMKETCQSAITPGVGSPGNLCPGTEKDNYDALHKCECDPTGKCAAACAADPACMGMTPGGACGMCLTDTAAGCGNEFATCNM